MRPHNEAEDKFAKAFATALKPHYEAAKDERKLNQLAKNIGVTAPALDRYLSGSAVPGLNTIVLAHKNLGIAVPFEEVDITTLLLGRQRRGRRKKIPAEQFDLPFEIRALGRSRKVSIRFRPRGSNRFQLEFRFAQKSA